MCIIIDEVFSNIRFMAPLGKNYGTAHFYFLKCIYAQFWLRWCFGALIVGLFGI